MAEKYISIVGVSHYFGPEIFKVGQKVILRKDHDNKQDDEAIQAELQTIGKVGYVANNYHTVAKGTRSAGRIYDSFDEVCAGEVAFIVKDTVIARVLPEEKVATEEESKGV